MLRGESENLLYFEVIASKSTCSASNLKGIMLKKMNSIQLEHCTME